MITPELTGRVRAAMILPMHGFGSDERRKGRLGFAATVLVGGAMALSACVSVTAPDKPIVIELNINIKHELIVQLAEDAKKTMDQHGEIF